MCHTRFNIIALAQVVSLSRNNCKFRGKHVRKLNSFVNSTIIYWFFLLGSRYDVRYCGFSGVKNIVIVTHPGSSNLSKNLGR